MIGRPKMPRSITFHVSDDTYDCIATLARSHGLRLSEYIRGVVDDHVWKVNLREASLLEVKP